MRRLIVNADDFGLTNGIDRAIFALHQSGALSSATMMAAAAQVASAAELSRQYPSLGIGCHIVLVDGSPVAEPGTIPSLLDDSGHVFRSTLGHFLRDLLQSRIDPLDIEREATAQILRLRQLGIAVTHVDTHKHTHMFPPVLKAVLRAAKACDIRVIRNPFEPQWSIAATAGAGFSRKLQVRLLRAFHPCFQRLVRHYGFFTTEGCLGVAATGTLNETMMRAIINQMPEGTWEMVCHPGYLDDELRAVRTRLHESRQTEFSILQRLPAVIEESSSAIEMVHFGQLVERPKPTIERPKRPSEQD